MQSKNKVLIIRFSSFGDIIQAMASLKSLKDSKKFDQIDWLTKTEFEGLVKTSENVDQVHAFDKKLGIRGLIYLAVRLRREGYTHIYDAHSNIRSRILSFFLKTFNFEIKSFTRRGKSRFKRFLLFNFRINKFPKPFRGMVSYVEPISKWLKPSSSEDFIQNLCFLNDSQVKELKSKYPVLNERFIAIAPSAAWDMKRWPVSHWESLLRISDEKHHFVVLGGPGDTFCQELADKFSNAHNLAGDLSLIESSWVVSESQCLVSADTGLIHVADIIGKSAIALIGPTAFGFPTHSHVKTLEVNLGCRPCTKDGRGKCIQEVYQKCMVDITPEMVYHELKIFR